MAERQCMHLLQETMKQSAEQVDPRLCTDAPRPSASINALQLSAITSVSPIISTTSAVAKGSSPDAPSPRSGDPVAAGHGSRPLADDGHHDQGICAGSRRLLPYSTISELRSSPMTHRPANVQSSGEVPSKRNESTDHSCLSSCATCTPQYRQSTLHSPCSAAGGIKCRCEDDDGGSICGKGAQSASSSSSSILPVHMMLQTKLKSRSMPESAQESLGSAHHAPSSPRRASAVRPAGAARRLGYTSYSVHRVLPRTVHPHFTGYTRPLRTQHYTSEPRPLSHAHPSSEHPMSAQNPQRLSLPLPPPHGTAIVLNYASDTNRSDATDTTSSLAQEKTLDNGVRLPSLTRADPQSLSPPRTWPNTQDTSSLGFRQPHPPLPPHVASLSPQVFATAAPQPQLQSEFTKLLSLGPPPAAPRTTPEGVFSYTAEESSVSTEMTLPASAGDAGTVVSSAFTSQLTKSTIPVVGEAIWKENLQSLSVLSQGSMNSFGTGDEKEDSDSATTSCVVSRNLCLAQEPRHHDNRMCAASLPKEATLVRNSEYSKRDIHRGTWIFTLARKECLARESLEAEETAEALRCLPASCAIWRTYCDRASGRASYDVESLSKSLDMNTYRSSDASNHAAVFGRTADCVFSSDRRSLGTKEAVEVKEPLTPPPHPAFVMAARRLELLEGIRRGYVTAEEEDEFQANLQKPYVYEHRLFVVGTLRLEGFLRPWVVIHRARKLRHARQIAKLQKLEQEARVALHATSHTLQRRFQLFMTALLEQEHHYRYALELLYTYQAARTGAVLLHLQEQAERFPLAYGAVMSRARVCGRVTGFTLFSNLSIAEQAIRKTIIDEEARRRAIFPTEFDMTALCLVHEVLRRRELVNCEANEHAMVQQVVRSLQAHYSIREVEIEESIERQFWLKGRTHGGTDPVVASASP